MVGLQNNGISGSIPSYERNITLASLGGGAGFSFEQPKTLQGLGGGAGFSFEQPKTLQGLGGGAGFSFEQPKTLQGLGGLRGNNLQIQPFQNRATIQPRAMQSLPFSNSPLTATGLSSDMPLLNNNFSADLSGFRNTLGQNLGSLQNFSYSPSFGNSNFGNTGSGVVPLSQRLSQMGFASGSFQVEPLASRLSKITGLSLPSSQGMGSNLGTNAGSGGSMFERALTNTPTLNLSRTTDPRMYQIRAGLGSSFSPEANAARFAKLHQFNSTRTDPTALLNRTLSSFLMR